MGKTKIKTKEKRPVTVSFVCSLKIFNSNFLRARKTAANLKMERHVTFWNAFECESRRGWAGVTGVRIVGATATAIRESHRACVALRHRWFCTPDTFLLQLIPALYSITPTRAAPLVAPSNYFDTLLFSDYNLFKFKSLLHNTSCIKAEITMRKEIITSLKWSLSDIVVEYFKGWSQS